jgi:sigma-B regulation protein RsbU (phosphoserine phosphatase)
MPEVLLERRFAAQAAELRSVRSAIRQALDILAVEPELRDRLVLAVDEACANIIRHGYGPHHEGDIGLRILRDGPVLSFELTDAAPCVDPASIRPKPLGECRSGGFGIALIDEVMDDWRIQPAQGGQGNLLILRKRIDGIGSEEASEA